MLADRHRRRIGILGGSFNPAHRGHRAISLIALQSMALDEIWWLVSPQNPLKPRTGMADLDVRVAEARRIARHPHIKVTGLEARLDSRYTADTLAILRRRFPRSRFVWLMGADNLIQIERWARWQRIFETTPVAIFARPGYSLRALAGKAAKRYARARVPPAAARFLADRAPPAWVFFTSRLMPVSATEIRARHGDIAVAANGPARRMEPAWSALSAS